MFNYEYTAKGEINLEKAWVFFSNVNFWQKWDEDLQEVIFQGAFVRGNKGIMKMKGGQTVPFSLAGVTLKKSFVTSFRTEEVVVVFSHILEQDAITIKVAVEGFDKEYINQIGSEIVPGVVKSVNNLFELVKVK